MKLEQREMVLLVGTLVAGVGSAPALYAYGANKKTESFLCEPPTFTRLAPEPESEIASFSEFSFLSSKNVNASTLVVKVNGQPVQVSAEDEVLGLQVKGTLAPPITEPGIVVVSAAIEDVGGQCPGRMAYRVKVSGAAAETQDGKSE